ncbi:MAG: MOSC domain-containing protein [bacterium]|nr:MOSC domain-containing protein [bacterium]
MPELYSICYTPHDAAAHEQSPDAYVRVQLTHARLVTGRGIDGDRKGRHPTRQLNIMSYEELAALGEGGLNVQPGAMGEQIILKGFNVADLHPGDRVQIGASAIFEMTDFRNGCERFLHIQGRDPQTLKRRLGIMARVVSDGPIQVGDPVRVVAYAAQSAPQNLE